jgi:hypothetical protein
VRQLFSVALATMLFASWAAAQNVTDVRSLNRLVVDGVDIQLLGVGLPSGDNPKERACAESGRRELTSLSLKQVVKLVADANVESPVPSSFPALRYVFLSDGRLLNQLVLAGGCARLADSGRNLKLWSQLASTNEQAQLQGVGLYASGEPDSAPSPTSIPATDTGVTPTAPISYVVTVTTPVRREPARTAPAIATMQPLDMMAVEKVFANWVCGTLTKADTRGCVPAIRANLLPRGFGDATITNAMISVNKWPLAIRLDVLRRKARIGFTAQQVRLAVGDPLQMTQSETATGMREIWLYQSQTIAFVNGKVAEIVSSK